MAIVEYVTNTISRETTFPRQAAFDKLLLLVNDADFDAGELFRLYASYAEAQADADLGDVAKAMLQVAFSQEQHVAQVAVASLPTPADETLYRLTPDGTSLTLGVTVIAPDGTETVVSGTGLSAGAALTDFVSELNGVSGLGCTSDSGAALVEPDGFGEVWRFKDFVNVTGYADESPDLGYDDHLGTLLEEAEGLDVYGICIDVNSPANISAVAAWALANDRVFYAGPEVFVPAAYTTTASALMAASNTRVLSLVKKAGKNEWAAVALGSKMRSKEPGSATYIHQRLAGVTADKWTTTQKNAFKAANVVMYIESAGIGHTSEGYTADGEYLDVIEGIDWIIARQNEGIFGAKIRADKIPMTDEGGALLAAQVRGPLLLAEATDRRILKPGSSNITVPLVDDIAAADRAARTFRTITWTAQLAGAVHYTHVRGGVTV